MAKTTRTQAALHKTAAAMAHIPAKTHNSPHKLANETHKPAATQLHNLPRHAAAEPHQLGVHAAKAHKSEHAPATSKVKSHSANAGTSRCSPGQSVLCPNSRIRCANSECCPDGSLCPSSAPVITGTHLGASCPKPKSFDCTGIKEHTRHRPAHSHRHPGVPLCLVGANVQCPHSTVNCSSGCCPDQSLCPSAPLGVTCPKPKSYDCTGQVQLSDSRWRSTPGVRAGDPQNLLLASASIFTAALALFSWQAGRRRRSRLAPDYLQLGSAPQLPLRATSLPALPAGMQCGSATEHQQ